MRPRASVLGETDSPGLIVVSMRRAPTTIWQPDNTAWGGRGTALPAVAPVCSGPSSEDSVGTEVITSQTSVYRLPRKGLQVAARGRRKQQAECHNVTSGAARTPPAPASSPTRCGNPGLHGVNSSGSGPLGLWSRPDWGPSSPRRSLPDPGADQEDRLQVAAVHCSSGKTPPGGEGPGPLGPAPVLSVPVPRWIPELGDPRLLEGWARGAAPPRTTANRKENYFAERAF